MGGYQSSALAIFLRCSCCLPLALLRGFATLKLIVTVSIINRRFGTNISRAYTSPIWRINRSESVLPVCSRRLCGCSSRYPRPYLATSSRSTSRYIRTRVCARLRSCLEEQTDRRLLHTRLSRVPVDNPRAGVENP